MPANLPPQFFALQKKLNQTKNPQEKIEILKEMLAVCPKHKGTERVQEEIKKKIAKLKKVLPKKVKTEVLYFVEKEGAGQVLILGPPNSGKTSLVNLLCQTDFKVGDWPFTTQLPAPAMMNFENISIQIVDTPPITHEFKPGWLKSLAKQADLILVVIDLEQNPKERLDEIFAILKEWQIETSKLLILGNKFDLQKAKENFEALKTEIGIFPFSTKGAREVEVLKKKIFERLNIVRVFTKDPKKGIDFENPFVLKKGAKLIDLVEEINEEWVEKFKGGKLFDKNLEKFKMVGKEYVLQDGDIVEIII